MRIEDFIKAPLETLRFLHQKELEERITAVAIQIVLEKNRDRPC